MNIIGHCIDPSGTLRVSSFQCGIQQFIPALYLCFLLFVSSFSSLTTYNHPLKNFPCFSLTVSVFRSLFEGLCFYCFLSSFHFHFHFHLISFSLSYWALFYFSGQFISFLNISSTLFFSTFASFMMFFFKKKVLPFSMFKSIYLIFFCFYITYFIIFPPILSLGNPFIFSFFGINTYANHRIIKYLNLERTHKDPPVQIPAPRRTT